MTRATPAMTASSGHWLESMSNKEHFHNTREEALLRDQFRCQDCGRTEKDGIELHAHHQQQRWRGGSDSTENLLSLCRDCHVERHGEKRKNPPRKNAVQCPHDDCRRYFDTLPDMKRHFSNSHGRFWESDYKIVDCPTCGELFIPAFPIQARCFACRREVKYQK